MRTKIWLPAILLAAHAIACPATTNGIDTRFGTAGVVILGPTPVNDLQISRPYALAIQADGKILVAGRGEDPANPGISFPAIGRLNSDGNWDTTFASNGIFVLPTVGSGAPNGGLFDNVRLFSDGSILASGGAYSLLGLPRYQGCTVLTKLTDKGAFDTTFASDHSGSFCFAFAVPQNPTYNSHFDGIVIDSDDTFYLTSPETNRSSGAVAQFDQTGALIPSFGFLGIASVPGIYTNLIQLLPDHTALAAGEIAESGMTRRLGAFHVDGLGNIDEFYGVNGIFANALPATDVGPTGAALDAQNRFLISDDDYDSETATYQNYRFIRVTASGQPDASFNGNGQQPGYPGFAQPVVSGDANTDYLVAAQPLPDGHIFAVGDAGQIAPTDGASNLALLRLNDDSSWDASFGDPTHPGWVSINVGGTSASTNYARAIATDASGGILVAASIDNDINGNACDVLIRIVPDRIFDADMSSSASFPSCPN